MKFINHFRYGVYLVVTLSFSTAKADAFADFFHAIRIDDASTVKSVLQRGFDANTRDPSGQPGLLLALQGESLRVADVLAASPALQVDTANPAGETALMLAALKGNASWCRRLLGQGAAVNRPGWSPLHYGAAGPEVKVIALLLEQGATVDAESPNRTTPLMMAARYGSEAGVDLLLARGADPVRRNDLELGPADFARLGGREALARRLTGLRP